MTDRFVATVEHGRFPEPVRKAIQQALQQFEGHVVEVTVRKYRKKRSRRQNARYWALLTVGAESLWEDRSLKETLHEELAHLYFGLPPCPKTGLRRRRRTPETETKEFGTFMEWAANKLVDLGADLSAWDAETEKTEAE